jgi:ATP-binding protein involved in chromosome partitioning
MTVTAELVLQALRRVKGPDLEGNIVDLGLVSDVFVDKGRAYFSITVPAARAEELEPLRQAAERVVKDLEGVVGVTAVLTAEAPRGAARPAAPSGGSAPESARVQAARAQAAGRAGASHSHNHSHGHSHGPAPAQTTGGGRSVAAVPGIKHIIAVASGKGGVGKSTVAVNLALGFKANGLNVGILDADIYGPSQPRLLGLTGKPQAGPDKKLIPMRGHGLEAMSIGFLVDAEQPIIFRGPMVVSALTNMLRDVAWGRNGDLDVLVIDMPPGTGDIQLSLAQQVPLAGAVIVSTPQDLALIDARKGLAMFQRVDVPVLGLIENMSYFICSKCGERHEIFGHGGAREEARQLKLPFLGAVPLDMDIRVRSDSGQPITATVPDGVHTRTFKEIAAITWAAIDARGAIRTKPPALDIIENGRALRVTFPDAAPFTLPAEMLRVMSPSAEVQGHSPEQRVTVGGKRNVVIKNLDPVGHYATRLVFDDGHSTGLYTWSYLRQLHDERDQRWAVYEAELAAKGLGRG